MSIETLFAPAIDHLIADLEKIEDTVTTQYTLADAIREGSTVTDQSYDWGKGESACALSAAMISASARGFL